jgi:small-conductance mechanosensitive channel
MDEITEAASGLNWSSIVEILKDNGIDSGTVVNFGKNLVIALLIFYVGRMAIALIVRGLRKLMQKQDVDKTLETFVCNLVRMALLVVVIIAAIGALGIQTTSFIAIFGAAGLAIGLALQGSLSNFAAGVLIVLFRPYRVGNYIEGAGISGTVEQVQILTTILITPDNKEVIVPNSQIMNSIITNYSANDTRRVDMVVGVARGQQRQFRRSALGKIRRLLGRHVRHDRSNQEAIRRRRYLIPVPATGRASVQGVRGLAITRDQWARRSGRSFDKKHYLHHRDIP